MKKQLITLLVVLVTTIVAFPQPTTFNYQAVVRDIDGNLIANQDIQFRVEILDNEQNIQYAEIHSIQTNEFGQVNVEVGGGTPQEGDFSVIPWGTVKLYLRTAISLDQGASYIEMGQAPLLAVPYALYSASGEPGTGIESVSDNGDGTLTFHFTDGSTYITPNLAGPTLEDQPGNLIYHDSAGWVGTDAIKIAGSNVAIGTNPAISRLLVHGDVNANIDDPIFEVKNKDGNVVFAVYQNGVEVNVDESTQNKALKGGFAVGGLTGGKDSIVQYFRVTPDSVRVYLKDDTTKAQKGGFAVGGLTSGKGALEYLRVTRDSTRVYVDNATKAQKGGFAVGGLTSGKSTDYYMNITEDNYFIGHQSGGQLNTGTYNSTLGYQSGYSVYNGNSNSFIGYQSGYSTTNGEGNLFLGYQSGFNNVEGYYNSFLGYQSGYSNTVGSANSFLASYSGYSNTTGNLNTFVGYESGFSNTLGTANTFIGSYVGQNNTEGNYNVYIGERAGYMGTNPDLNVFIGYRSGYEVSSGSANVAIGYRSGYSLNNGNDNVFLGTNSGYNIEDGYRNICLGSNSGYALSNGDNNVFIGDSTGYSGGSVDESVFMGSAAGKNALNSTENVFIGYQCGYHTTNSNFNVYIGNRAGRDNNGGNNVFIGRGTGRYVTAGTNNVYMGIGAGGDNAEGDNNTYIGTLAGGNGVSGSKNVYIGNFTGGGAVGDSNVFIGNFAGYSESGSQKLYIDNTSTSSPLIKGDFNSNCLQVNGNFYYTGSFGACSDARYKKNIQPISNALSYIMKLQGINYYWRQNEFPDVPFSNRKQIGLIAQDVEKLIPELVSENNDGYKTIDYAKLTPLLIESIKSQQESIEKQKLLINELVKRIEKLENN